MLKLYICPNCKSVRYVSLENTACYKCDLDMLLSDTPYADYIKLDNYKRQCCVEEFLTKSGAAPLELPDMK